MRYFEAVKEMEKKRMARVGDKISAKGITCTIGEIFFNDRYVEKKDGEYTVFYDIEFKDTNGNYRHWKSYFDGGKLILMDDVEETNVLYKVSGDNQGEHGDFVKCVNCGKLMLVNIGEDNCPECGKESLVFVDNDNPEYTRFQLEELGYTLNE